jgi:hypothetical protein
MKHKIFYVAPTHTNFLQIATAPPPVSNTIAGSIGILNQLSQLTVEMAIREQFTITITTPC